MQLRLKSKAPHLEPHLTKSCGFATGLEFRESAFQLNAKSEQVFRAGMVFNLALGLENLEDKDATDSRGKKYALFLAETVLVKVALASHRTLALTPLPNPPQHLPNLSPTSPQPLPNLTPARAPAAAAAADPSPRPHQEEGANEVLTERAPKQWGDISYYLKDDDEEEEAGPSKSSKSGR